MSDIAATQEGQQSAGLNQVQRVMDTFISPSKTFTDLLRNTSWWLPFLLACIFSICATFVIDKQVGWDTVVQNTIHSSPKQEERFAQMDPQQRATQIHAMAMGYRYSSFASPLFILVLSAAGSLVLWASFNFGLGARTSYGQILALWMYASLPRLLTSILMMITLWFGGNAEAFDFKSPVGTNLGFYLPDAAPWIRVLLSFGDVIGLWVLALMILGTALVAKVKLGQAAAVVVGWWVLVVILSVVGTALTS